MRGLCLLVSAIAFGQSFGQSVDTIFYSAVKGGTISGEQKSWQVGPNEYHYTYYFNDRGRGSNINAVVRTNDNGFITALNATGFDYYKNPYTENFKIEGDSAVWDVNGDRKAKKFANQCYTSTPAPAIDEITLRWLVKQPGKRADVLPEGFIYTKDPSIYSISLNAKTASLKLYAIYFDTIAQPIEYLWVSNDMHFFASVSAWMSILRKGYESWADTLFSLQERADKDFYTAQMKKFSSDVPAHVLIMHARLFESSTATVKNDMSVEIGGGKIIAVYPSAKDKTLPAGQVIDAKGKFLMPGLWDMHAHYSKDEGAWYLAGGVTHVRDMGNANIIFTYKQEIAANEMLGPDVSYISGFIDKQDYYQGPTGKIVASLDEAIKAVDEYHELGCGQIKLYSSIKPEWVAPIAAHAHSLGMRVAGHIPAFMTAEEAIKAGYDEITHINFVFLNFMGDTIDTRGPTRFRVVGDRAGKIDLNSDDVKHFISLMKQKKISFDPTMNVFAGMFAEFKGDTSGSMKPVISWLPDRVKSDLSIQTPFGNDEQKPAYQLTFNNMQKMLKLLYDNGVLLVAGTDGGEAIALHHELEIYVQSGIPANEALKIATYNAALDCGLQDKYGQILPGRDADLILIDGDPAQNISDVRRVEWVIKNGKMYSPKQLLASQGWKYYY